MQLPRWLLIISIFVVLILGITFGYIIENDTEMNSNDDITKVFYLEGSDEKWTISKQFFGTLDNNMVFQGGEIRYTGDNPMEIYAYDIKIILIDEIMPGDADVISTTAEQLSKAKHIVNGDTLSINSVSGPFEGNIKKVILERDGKFHINVVINYKLKNGESIEDVINLNIYEFNFKKSNI